jgi:N-acetylated-alpha-linked acidic dipeptidase
VDGDVTAPLVYVNYGIPEDYERLERLGVDVKGKIVIARYGGGWRGIKPKVAAEKGAVGCIIYSDPKNDGFYEGEVYPKGPFRPEQGVQRGSVKDMPLYSGDPLTPGVGATKDAKRLDRASCRRSRRFPFFPISGATRSRCLPLSRDPSRPRAGAARSRSRTASDPGPRRFT